MEGTRIGEAAALRCQMDHWRCAGMAVAACWCALVGAGAPLSDWPRRAIFGAPAIGLLVMIVGAMWQSSRKPPVGKSLNRARGAALAFRGIGIVSTVPKGEGAQ